MLDEGLYTSVSEIGDAENISKSYVSRILRLALLAPDIVDAIRTGRTDQGADAGEAGAAVPDPTSCGRARMASVCAEAIRVEHPAGRRAWRAPTR